MKKNRDRKKIVVIGGGTGNFVLLSGLKQYPLDITAIVSVADSGGSTGRLRSEFGFLPVGDIRQCLAAMADDTSIIRQILLYRFSKGFGLRGHNLGNLILTALTDITGSEPKAIEAASRIFRLKGKILPVTTANIQLKAVYENGKEILGEHNIDEPKHKGGLRIVKLEIEPKASIYSEAKKAIMQANMIILGPGDLYTSVLPNLIVKGVQTAIFKSKAKILYVANLMTRYSQTHNYTVGDHVFEIEKYLGRKVNFIAVNNDKIPLKYRLIYQKEHGFPVIYDGQKLKGRKIILLNLMGKIPAQKPKGDILQRSYLRHNSKKLAKVIISLLK